MVWLVRLITSLVGRVLAKRGFWFLLARLSFHVTTFWLITGFVAKSWILGSSLAASFWRLWAACLNLAQLARFMLRRHRRSWQLKPWKKAPYYMAVGGLQARLV